MEWGHQRFSQLFHGGGGKHDGRPEERFDSGLDSLLDTDGDGSAERPRIHSESYVSLSGGEPETHTEHCVSLSGGGERLDSAIGDSITDEAAAECLSAGIRTALLLRDEVEEVEVTSGRGRDTAGDNKQNTEELWRTLSFLSEDGDTALHLALIHENWGFVQYLLELISINRSWTPYLDIQNDLGQTALHLAVIMDRSECVSVLLEAGASAELQERGGHTPLHLAVREQRTECVRELTSCNRTNQNHLNITNYTGVSALHLAVQKGCCDMINMLLKAGADVNQRDQGSGRTPLHWAVETQSCAIVELLLTAGASVDQPSYAGHTPLYCALYRPNKQLQALLESAGASTPEEDEEEGDDDDDKLLESDEEEFDDVIINGQRVL
ncbi:NF-kappa-B inhibitor beta [Hoplias malabaricus]|uniref:NF-kappa-B inhibitor beta n=1 Tax=Hoplias malabaricus TaxID=27720 RepID=UPI0034627AB7